MSGAKGIKKPHPLGSVPTRPGVSQLTVVASASSATANGDGMKISELPAAAAVIGSDQLEVNQSGTSRRLTIDQVVTAVVSSDQISDAIESALVELSGGLTADYAATTNLTLPNPVLIGGLLYVDGVVQTNGARIFALSQTNAKDRRIYTYGLTDNVLLEAADMPDGMILTPPLQINVVAGETYTDTNFALNSTVPRTVGTDDLIWIASEEAEQGAIDAGFGWSGPAVGYSSPKLPTWRPTSPYDAPEVPVTRAFFAVLRSPYINRKSYGITSNYKNPANHFAQRGMLNSMLAIHNEIEVDEDLYLEAQVTASLSNKRLIFNGRGFGGRARVLMTGNASFLDVSGSVNFRMDGPCVCEYIRVPAAAAKAIKATSSFTNLQIESFLTKGCDFAISFGIAHQGYTIGEVGTYAYPGGGTIVAPTEVPFVNTNTAGAAQSFLGRVVGLPKSMDVTFNSSMTFKAFVYSSIIRHTGAITANRVATLHHDNVYDGYTVTLVRTSTGAFTIDVTDGSVLKSLPTNSWGTFTYDAATSLFRLTAYGSL